MLNRKIENIWFYTAIFCVVIVLLNVFYTQVVAFEMENNESLLYVKKTAEKKEITLIFGGDVMLARTVEQKILAADDFSLPFRKIADEFSGADLAFVNLESPFYDGGSATPNGSVVFRALPDSIQGLQLAGIDIVSLANNHFGNQGVAGERYTFQLLNENNIEYCGAGENFLEAHTAKIIEINDTKIGFLAYAYPETLYVAGNNSPGVANMDISQMKKDVEILSNSVDFVVVSMHAGAEYTHNPGSFQVDFAHAAVDSGADLIIGHHSHVVQTTEKYNNSYIIYGLGNLVFDQMWSEETQQGVVAKVMLEDSGLKSIEFNPVHIYDYNQPDWADEDETSQILNDMNLKNGTIEF